MLWLAWGLTDCVLTCCLAFSWLIYPSMQAKLMILAVAGTFRIRELAEISYASEASYRLVVLRCMQKWKWEFDDQATS